MTPKQNLLINLSNYDLFHLSQSVSKGGQGTGPTWRKSPLGPLEDQTLPLPNCILVYFPPPEKYITQSLVPSPPLEAYLKGPAPIQSFQIVTAHMEPFQSARTLGITFGYQLQWIYMLTLFADRHLLPSLHNIYQFAKYLD